MSAKPEIPAEDQITVEINGQAYPARKGQMLIEVADENGIPIPRFCYHKKLPIAANCRMCLVEVEKAPKPLPACATPLMDGMKVWTESDYAREAQKSVMEFLLINHPLDCPICDQGGECELQDLSVGYGRDLSRFAEAKRVVADEDIGPLIATEMTRCIHCTRCVRFLEHIAGHKELGGMGRGENTRIGTYVGQAIGSEMSGNVIDVCPVGALTAKPSRFRARPWELTRHPAIAPHDCIGSNLYLHSRRGQVLRAVPRDNESVNEVWLADRDRFSYQGLSSRERLTVPMLKEGGEWREVDWDRALTAVAEGIKAIGGGQLGLLASPSATLEEMHLLNGLAEGIGCANLDHRLRQTDFSDQQAAAPFPWLGQTIEDLERLDCVLLIGSNIRKDQPIAGHRLRKAWLAGATLMAVNPVDYDFHFRLAHKAIVRPSQMVAELAAVARAVADARDGEIPAALAGLLGDAEAGETHRAMAEALLGAERGSLLLGLGAAMHPAAATLRALALFIAERAGLRMGQLSDGANAAGGWLAGVLPHRTAGGAGRSTEGLDVGQMLADPLAGYLLFGCEPQADFADPSAAMSALGQAPFVAALTSFVSDELRQVASVLLPVATFAETSGTYVNAEGCWQSFAGAVPPPGEVRPGWKVLRVLGNLLDVSGFSYMSSQEVRDELRGRLGDLAPALPAMPARLAETQAGEGEGLERIGEPAIYAVDALVRRAPALQAAADGGPARVHLHPADAERLGLADGGRVRVSQGAAGADLELVIDPRVAPGAVWIPSAAAGSEALGSAYGRAGLAR
ncbi:NADH-quinone oxidoreductase subunit NuoG [Thiohalobacter sp. IOR34]|uniref:NADH-quinone oxidoreductase subunit NuoG n=1 Tax=Thiohalobacter sp. IOR34 TaxID=3057176 RepID=UPI0025B0E1A6|nr:NADH-quinone oxidoreductase subunit NuoG [Thiohalobacter sp. IOR34]WJW76476.1 NADH-quinone oxidoreductase subunit NuoG [Thiohalobacter sp. IOR34]